MNQIKKILKEQGRSIVWAAAQLDKPERPMSRSLMDWKIDHDSFEDWERRLLVERMGVVVTFDQVFPDAIEEGEPA